MSEDPIRADDRAPEAQPETYREEAESGVRRRPQAPNPAAPQAGDSGPQDRSPQAPPTPPQDGMALLGQQILAQVYYDFVARPQQPSPPADLEGFGRALFDRVQRDFGSTPPPASAGPANDGSTAPDPGFHDQPTVPYGADELHEPPDWMGEAFEPGDEDVFATPLQRAWRKITSPFRRGR